MSVNSVSQNPFITIAEAVVGEATHSKWQGGMKVLSKDGQTTVVFRSRASMGYGEEFKWFFSGGDFRKRGLSSVVAPLSASGGVLEQCIRRKILSMDLPFATTCKKVQAIMKKILQKGFTADDAGFFQEIPSFRSDRIELNQTASDALYKDTCALGEYKSIVGKMSKDPKKCLVYFDELFSFLIPNRRSRPFQREAFSELQKKEEVCDCFYSAMRLCLESKHKIKDLVDSLAVSFPGVDMKKSLGVFLAEALFKGMENGRIGHQYIDDYMNAEIVYGDEKKSSLFQILQSLCYEKATVDYAMVLMQFVKEIRESVENSVDQETLRQKLLFICEKVQRLPVGQHLDGPGLIQTIEEFSEKKEKQKDEVQPPHSLPQSEELSGNPES